jgi:hypothetical protein
MILASAKERKDSIGMIFVEQYDYSFLNISITKSKEGE